MHTYFQTFNLLTYIFNSDELDLRKTLWVNQVKSTLEINHLFSLMSSSKTSPHVHVDFS